MGAADSPILAPKSAPTTIFAVELELPEHQNTLSNKASSLSQNFCCFYCRGHLLTEFATSCRLVLHQAEKSCASAKHAEVADIFG